MAIDLSCSFFDPSFQWKNVHPDGTFGFCSLLLVIDILVSVFVTHRKTYEVELDVLKAWYLIPACWCLALVAHTKYEGGETVMLRYCWSSTLLMDALTLMPQVVMMAQ